jgi:peptidylprolyl isomerase
MKYLTLVSPPYYFILFFYLTFLGSLPHTFADEIAKTGDQVTIDYEGSLEDGVIFDNSKSHDKPFQFIIGSGQVIPGFDKAVTGMKVMEEKKFTLQPTEAYGEINQKLIHKVMRSGLPPKPEPKPGMGLMMGGGPGKVSRRAMITEVTKEYILIDMNHSFAGKSLTFAVKLIKILN